MSFHKRLSLRSQNNVMLELKFFRQDKDRIIEGLNKRCIPKAEAMVTQVLVLDDRRKEVKTKLDKTLAERNTLSKEIGMLYKSGRVDEAKEIKKKVQEVNAKASVYHDELDVVEADLKEALLHIPNIPHDLVPAGDSEEDNEVYQDWNNELLNLWEGAEAHWELAQRYNLIDFELGAKITGAGFPLFRSKGAQLKRALVNFFLSEASKAGYEEILPPHLVNDETAYATGQLPDKEGQMYHTEKDDLYLIPTAEVPVTNIFRDVIVKEEELPYKMTAYTPCFRREAGSYGSHVKGLNRVHQFDKVEIVRIEHPANSYAALQDMLTHVSGLLDKLGLPYRILRLCGGDLGFTSALTYDFEVYSAAQKRWLEVSSVSNFETFQSNRLKCRYKDGQGKSQFVHTLNGSALALARIVAALLENNQTPDGIILPDCLVNFTGFKVIN